MGLAVKHAVAAAAIGLLFGLVWTAGPTDAQPDVVRLSPRPVRDASRAAWPSVAPPGHEAVVAAAEPPPEPGRSVAAEVERLARSADVRDAMLAYSLVDRCIRAREAEAAIASLPRTPENQEIRHELAASPARASEVCRGLSSAQIAGRLSLLERAASAGVPGAAVALAEEGPFGDRSALEQRPDDPLVVDWKRHVVELMQAAAHFGDRASMVALSTAFQGGGLAEREPQQALAYWIAQSETTRLAGGRVSRNDGHITAALSSGLTPEQVAAAIEQGHKLAASCCSKRPS